MDPTFSAPQYAYPGPQLEDEHLLLSGSTNAHFSHGSSCSTPEYLSDAQIEWEFATVDGLPVNPGQWPTSSAPYPDQYDATMQPILLSHQYDAPWPFASRGFPEEGSNSDSLLGGSFDVLMKSINQRPDHPQHQAFDSNNFQYFTQAHLQLEDPSLAALQSPKLFQNSDLNYGPYIHSSDSEPSLVKRSPHMRASHSRERSSSVKNRRSENSGTMHKCDSCSYSFSRARDLTRHYRLHTGEKPYKCDACDERFIRSDARKRHWDAQPSCRFIHDQKNGDGSSTTSSKSK